MLTIKQQTAARGSSTSPQAGQKPLPLSERSQLIVVGLVVVVLALRSLWRRAGGSRA
jgi:hypothetical protein